ncbi:MAG: carboxypeptidase regulatory-like domain-containing protein, partial [Ruminococcus sp.]|nr:carboxypeptidase regulatory-like domain-containing protein [Ruminococcus sp.]
MLSPILFIADVNVSDGTEDKGSFSMYSAEDEGMYIGGKYYTADEIAKNPESFGFIKSTVKSESDGNTYSYYYKSVDNKDAVSTMLNTFSGFGEDLSSAWSGEAVLQIVEGDYSETLGCRILNNYVTDKVGDVLKKVYGAEYVGIGNMISITSDTINWIERVYNSNGNMDYICGANAILAIKAFNTFGGTEAVLGMCGIMPPVSTVISIGIEVALSYVEDYLDYCIENNMEFSLSGFIRFIIDPSGIVYEAVKSNHISGAEMTVYYLDVETNEAVLWNAEDYEQANPIYTNSEGAYAWDVPEGKWKVVCELEGYETQESEWLDVPPVQTEVDFSLVSYEAPSIKSVEHAENGIVVTFTKFMDAATVTEDTLTIDAEVAYTVAPKLYDAADAYTDTFIISGDFTSVDTVTVTASADCMS